MKESKFEELIKFEELAKTNDTTRFMYKAYLKCLLKGGKIWEDVFMYSVSRDIARNLREGEPIIDEMERAKKLLIELFRKLKIEKKYTHEEHDIEYFDENGKEIDVSAMDFDKRIISKQVHTDIKTIYYLDDSLKIKPFGVKK